PATDASSYKCRRPRSLRQAVYHPPNLYQKMNFRANCTSRLDVVVVEITPNVAVLNVRPGRPKLGWFKALNSSGRNCSMIGRSVSLKFLNADRSQLFSRGPVPVFRPTVPKA